MRQELHPTLGASIVISTLSLSACGGGGGGSDDPVTGGVTDINSSNGRALAGDVLDSLVLLSDTSLDMLELIGLGGGASVGERNSGKSILPHGLIVELPRQTFQYTRACSDGGRITVTENDANNNGAPDAGDSLSISSAACQVGSMRYHGGVVIGINHFSESSTATSLNFLLSFNQLSATDSANNQTASMNGALELAMNLSNNHLSLAARSSGLSTNDNGVTLNLSNYSTDFTLDNVQWARSLAFTANGSLIGGSLSGSTNPAFSGNVTTSVYPLTGVFTVNGANGSFVSLDAGTGAPDTVMVDINGSNLVVTWSDLDD